MTVMPFAYLADAATGFFVGFPLVIILLMVVGSIFWLWMLVDCITNTSIKDTEKLIWVLVVLFMHFIGALLYFVMVRGKGAGGTPV